MGHGHFINKYIWYLQTCVLSTWWHVGGRYSCPGESNSSCTPRRRAAWGGWGLPCPTWTRRAGSAKPGGVGREVGWAHGEGLRVPRRQGSSPGLVVVDEVAPQMRGTPWCLPLGWRDRHENDWDLSAFDWPEAGGAVVRPSRVGRGCRSTGASPPVCWRCAGVRVGAMCGTARGRPSWGRAMGFGTDPGQGAAPGPA